MIETSFLRTFKAMSLLEGIRSQNVNLYGFYGYTKRPFKTVAIADVESTNPAIIVASSHGIPENGSIQICGVGGIEEINSTPNTSITDYTVLDEDRIRLDLFDSTLFGSYTSGGYIKFLIDPNTSTSFDLTCDDESLIQIRNNALGLKRITGDCASLVIPRIDYKQGTIYEPYSNKKCEQCSYVVTDIGNVYFLIDTSGRASLAQPSHTTPWPKKYPDGHTWQYMYSVDLNNDKFVTDEYIPIRELCVADGSYQYAAMQANKANSGKITSIEIINEGNGYTDGEYEVDIIGTGIGAKAKIFVTDSRISGVEITERGSGYVFAHISGNFSDNTEFAEFRVNVEPTYSIGSSQLFNSCVSSIMFVWDFSSSENGKFMIDNSYCVYGLLLDPKLKDGEKANDLCYDLRKKLTLSVAPSTMVENEKIYSTNVEAVVISIGGNNLNEVFVSREGPLKFKEGDQVFGEQSGSSNTIQSIEDIEIEDGSGVIISYHLTSSPINRDINQRERYRLVIDL